jgi:hypothetical protein
MSSVAYKRAVEAAQELVIATMEVSGRLMALLGRSTNSAPENWIKDFWCLFGVYYERAPERI